MTVKKTTELKRLIVTDIDSTLINQEVIDLLGEACGHGERIADITARAMRGELDFAQALAERVSLLEGLDESVFEHVYSKITFTSGACEMVEEAHRRGWTVGAVSGGFHEIADRLVREAGIDHCLANRLEIKDGKLAGRTVGPIVTKDLKLQTLREWAALDGVQMSDTAAVGDGANDIPMILASGIGIAFCAKPAVAQAAKYSIEERNLMKIFDIIDGK